MLSLLRSFVTSSALHSMNAAVHQQACNSRQASVSNVTNNVSIWQNIEQIWELRQQPHPLSADQHCNGQNDGRVWTITGSLPLFAIATAAF
jgi:hypothetical protein